MRVARPALFWSLLLITAAGLALRVAAAQGGLWLDEAWSAVFARDVATPAGVLLNINHDNNHHLNTLWLQLVGFGADPLLQRALAIVSGTATIVVAGWIGARRSAEAAVVTALLFAVSPILVTLGSEARGYAPMLLALIASVGIVDRWLDRRERAVPTIGLAILAGLGMFAQLTMAFGLAAIGGWVFLRVLRQEGFDSAVRASARAAALPIASAATVAVLIFGIARARGGFQFGSLEPFEATAFGGALSDALAYAFGSPSHVALAVGAMIAIVVALVLSPSVRPRAPFYALAILGLPAAMLVLQLPNSSIVRYYLLSAAALLLLAGDVAGPCLARRGAARWVTGAALAVILVGSLWRDLHLIRNQRADPGRAVAAMTARAPKGTTASVDRPRAAAVLDSAAASRRYPLTLAACGRFLFVDRDGVEAFPATPSRCGARYRVIAGGAPTGLSGTHWRLYERVGTP